MPKETQFEALEGRIAKFEERMSRSLEKLKKLDDLILNQRDLHESFTHFNKEFEAFREAHNDSLKSIKDLTKKTQFLEAENLQLREEIKSLRNAVEETIYEDISADMEISGLSSVPGENLKETLISIANRVSVKLNADEIKRVQRIPAAKNRTNVIRVTLGSRILTDSFLMAGRRAKLKAEDCGQVGKDYQVFFNECLSAYAKKLFYEARKFKVEMRWKFVWTKSGKIFLRKAEKEDVIRISCLNDLLILKK